MREYHKINTIFKRDARGHIIEGSYSLPEFEYLKDNQWVFTEKIDGTNIRVMWDGKAVSYGGKTDKAAIPAILLESLENLFGSETVGKKFAEKFGGPNAEPETSICLYGEGYGARIQKGGGNYIKDGVSFILFDVTIGNWWMKRDAVEEIAAYFAIRVVPIVGTGTLNDAIELTRKGQKSQWGDFLSEGIVARPSVELRTRRGDRIITKIKREDFK
ncbi:MAG: RNA ligase family protein [Methylococcales bacterium]